MPFHGYRVVAIPCGDENLPGQGVLSGKVSPHPIPLPYGERGK